MSIDKAREFLIAALAELDPLNPSSTPIVPIRTPDALDRALSVSPAGAAVVLAKTFIYPGPLTITKPVLITCELLPIGRMTKDLTLPRFQGGITLTDGVKLIGLDIRQSNPLTDIVQVVGKDVTLDRCRILGDPDTGAKRGISANSNGNLIVRQCYVDDCFQASPGNDSQAIAAWDMGHGLVIEDCYLSGGSETILLGGADPTSDARTPADVTIRGCTITKNPAWQGLPVGVKNLVEFKNCKRVLFEQNDCSYAWAQGQTGFLLVLSVRNQDGKAPFSTIQDVTIRNNTWAHGAAAINILGRDDIKESKTGRDVAVGLVRPSVPMARVTIQGDTFTDINPAKYAPGMASKLIMVGGGPIDLTIDGVSFASPGGLSSALYFQSGPAADRFTFTNVKLPATSYGIFGAGVSASPKNYTLANPAWKTYTINGTIANVTEG